MNYVSRNMVIDSFDSGMVLNPGVNGKEYRLFGGLLDFLQLAIRNGSKSPLCFGKFQLEERLFGSELYLCREHNEISGFPDCVYVNEKYVLCIDHFRINASEPRGNYDHGDEYSAFIATHLSLFEQGRYDELENLLEEEGVMFSSKNLKSSLLHSLNKKISKVSRYKKVVSEFIGSGNKMDVVKVDLAKKIEVWLFIEDITPTTSFESAFFNWQFVNTLEECKDLDGLIYLHHPNLTRISQSINDVVFIHNDLCARNQLNSLASDKLIP